MSSALPACLIIGASGGIGSAFARLIAAEGSRLILCGRNGESLAEQAVQLPATTDPHSVLIADINRAEDRTRVIQQVHDQAIGLVVNLSGINQLSAFRQQNPDTIEQMISTNLTAAMLLTRELLEHAPGAGCNLIHTGSALGAIGLPGYASYCATKFALRGFCEALSRELGDDGPVQVRYFSPRATATPLNSAQADQLNRELGNKIDPPEQVAKALLQFIHSGAGSYQVGWQEKLFVRLNGALPGLVSQQIKKQRPTYDKYLK